METQERTVPQIELRGLSKVYQIPGGEVQALNNINLAIEQGDIYGIIGMSGAGKSTLIRCLNRLDTPTDGQVLIDGQNVLAMSKKQLLQTRRRMAMIFQQFNLLMQKSVARNVRYPLEIAGAPKKQANERVMELLKIVGLCDEATSALDPMTTQSILELLKKINAELGITVVLITHEMAVIRQICNKVAILDGGKLVEQGTVDDVFMHTKSAAGKRLFGILPENEDDVPTQPALRIVFDGSAADQPVISRLVKDLGFDVNILAADMHQFNGKTYGQMMVARPEDPAELKQVQDYLAKAGLTTEEVSGQ